MVQCRVVAVAGLAVAGLALVALLGGCAQGTGSAGGVRVTSPVMSSPASSTPVTIASGGGTASRVPVVSRVRTPVIAEGGQVRLDPPPRSAVPAVSAGQAFGTARRSYGDPRGSDRPRVALASYTNTVQGTVRADGSTRLAFVDRLVWVVADHGGICRSSGGPAPAPGTSPRPQPSWHQCLWLTFVDAGTGQDLGQSTTGGPEPNDITLD